MRLTSNDGFDFFVEKEVVPKGLPQSLTYDSKIVEKIVEYLHYKHVNVGVDINKVQQFDLDQNIALEVLKASLELKI